MERKVFLFPSHSLNLPVFFVFFFLLCSFNTIFFFSNCRCSLFFRFIVSNTNSNHSRLVRATRLTFNGAYINGIGALILLSRRVFITVLQEVESEKSYLPSLCLKR